MDTGRAAHSAGEEIPAPVPAPGPGGDRTPCAERTGPGGDRTPRAEHTDPVPFTPDTLLWDMVGDIRVLLYLPAALVLQVAHPAVGAGVDEHSVFRTDPWGRARRSLDSLQLWVYGGDRAVEEGAGCAAAPGHQGHRHPGTPVPRADARVLRLGARHRLPRLPAGRRVSVPPVRRGGERRLHAEARRLGRILGIRERDMPGSVEEFRTYFDAVVREELERTAVVEELLDPRRPPPDGAGAVLRLLWPVLRPALLRLQVFVTKGLLPPVARERLDVTWTARDERRLRLLGRVVRTVVPRLPERFRYLPVAYAARRAARA